MDEQDSQPHAGPRATDLIADFHARHEAWRRQGENLERLRADARAAAALEAAAILTTARGDIRRAIVEARRALAALTEQLKAITDQSSGQVDEESPEDVPYSVLQARRDLSRLLTDMRPELDELAEHTEQFAEPEATAAGVAEPPVVPAVAINEAEQDAALAAIAPLFEQELEEEPPAVPVDVAEVAAAPAVSAASAASAASTASAASVPSASSRFGMRGAMMVIAAISVASVGGAAWWMSDAFSPADLSRTVASIPPAPRQKPVWLVDQAPTISATLIGVPAAQPTAAEPPSATAPTAAAAVGGPDAGR